MDDLQNPALIAHKVAEALRLFGETFTLEVSEGVKHFKQFLSPFIFSFDAKFKRLTVTSLISQKALVQPRFVRESPRHQSEPNLPVMLMNWQRGSHTTAIINHTLLGRTHISCHHCQTDGCRAGGLICSKNPTPIVLFILKKYSRGFYLCISKTHFSSLFVI